MLNQWSPGSSTLFDCWSFSEAATAPWSSRTWRCSSGWLFTGAPDRSQPFVGPIGCLDRTAMDMAGLDIGPGGRPTRDGRRLASARLRVVLDTPIPSAGRPAADRRRHPTPGSGDGRRKPTLGRASHPWGIVEAGVRRLRADGFSADAAAAEATLSELAHVPQEPSRLDGRGRLLCRPYAHLPDPVRLRRPRPRSAPHLAHQRDAASHIRVDPPAASRVLPGPLHHPIPAPRP